VCGNSKCIEKSLLCDGVANCFDLFNSDEEYCGDLFFSILSYTKFCISVGCVFKIVTVHATVAVHAYS